MAAEVTKEKILDAAEELFSDNGFSATSIRAITSRAVVNLAALNYHFGSKEALIDAVFERRIGPLNRERTRLLDEFELQSGEQEVALERVLEAFLAPAIRLASDPSSGGKEFMRLMGRAHTESGDFFKNTIAKQFKEVFQRFSAAFHKALPHLPPEELYWRIHFVVGSMAFTMSHKLALRYMEAFQSQGVEIAAVIVDEESDVVLARLVRFAAAGLRTKVPQSGEVG